MSPSPPPQLHRYFDENFTRSDFHVRRRSALVKSPPYGEVVALCVVQAFSGAMVPERVPSPRRYEDAVFYEDWLSATECRSFIEGVQNGDIKLGDLPVIRGGQGRWTDQAVPLSNMFMPAPGFVVVCQVEVRAVQYSQGPLVSISEPYFPSIAEAIREWTGLTVYNGQSDSRNGSVIFLLPEQRAFLKRAVSNNGQLSFEIDGRDANAVGFTIKGAYNVDGALHHFECAVHDRRGTASVPDFLDRLEYVLLDVTGQIYHFQQEHGGRHTGIARERITSVDATLAGLVEEARRHGEGQFVEFKPFVDPSEQLGPIQNRSKLGQIVQSVVAFSNAQGGRIFIGIDDSCVVADIDTPMRAWGRAPASEDLLDRYRGALVNKIRGAIAGDISITLSLHGFRSRARCVLVTH